MSWKYLVVVFVLFKRGLFVVVCLNWYGNFTFFGFIRCWHNDKWLVIGFCLFLIFNLILDIEILFELIYFMKLCYGSTFLFFGKKEMGFALADME